MADESHEEASMPAPDQTPETPDDAAEMPLEPEAPEEFATSGACFAVPRDTEASKEETAVAVAEEAQPEPDIEPSEAEVSLMAIRDAAVEVKAKRAEYESLKIEAKDAKDAWEAAVQREQDIIDEATREYPLFDQTKAKLRAQIGKAVESAKADAVEKVKAVAGEGWREWKLSRTKIPANIVAILAESSYLTIGDVANLTQSGMALTDIAGVGPAKATKIEEALADFWAEHGEFCEPRKTPAPAPSQDEITKALAEEPDHAAPDPDEVDLEEDASEDE